MSRSWQLLSGVMVSVALILLLNACETTAELPDVEANQEIWTGKFASTTNFGSNGVDCGNGTVWVAIEGSRAHAKAFNRLYKLEYDVTANITDNGVIEGGFAVSSRSVATLWGTLSDDAYSGEFEDSYDCKGTWTITKD